MVFCTATSKSIAPSAISFRPVVAAGLLLTILLVSMLPDLARADPTAPPSRVGRVGFIDGDVSFFTDREEGWQKARMNFPVTGKNSVWTNGPSRAEVRLGASAVRLDADTMLDFVVIDDSQTNLYLQRGNLNIRVRGYNTRQSAEDTYRDQFRIETNSGSWTLEQNGRYRVESMQDRNETRISVYAGQARFDNGSAQLKVEAGKSLRVSASGGASSFAFDRATESVFDRWAEARDQRWDETHQRYASERVLSPYMTGYEELDANGDWIDEPEYGRLWTPRVVVSGWVPYRYGAWSYVRPWGWTWIDEAPWGFAPFHYGRWVQLRTRWYWAPGQYQHRPTYAPALVGWYGNGNTSISIRVGSPIGWFPLAPREHFIPTYTNSTTYIRNINYITNNTIVTAPTQFRNQGAGGTVVNQNVVVRGEPVWRSATIGGPSGRMVKPARDPMDSTQDNRQSWVPTAPPSAPVQIGLTPLPRQAAIAGEVPVARRPTWIHGEATRPQNGVPPIPPSGQSTSTAAPTFQSNTAQSNTVTQPPFSNGQNAPTAPATFSGLPPRSNVGEPSAPIARPKPNPRPITSPPPSSPSPSPPVAESAATGATSPSYAVTTIPAQGAASNWRGERIERTEAQRAESQPSPREMYRPERVERPARVERNESRVERGEARAVEPRAPRSEGSYVNPPRAEPLRAAPAQIHSPAVAIGKPKETREDKPVERNSAGEGRAPQSANKAVQPYSDERTPRVVPQ